MFWQRNTPVQENMVWFEIYPSTVFFFQSHLAIMTSQKCDWSGSMMGLEQVDIAAV